MSLTYLQLLRKLGCKLVADELLSGDLMMLCQLLVSICPALETIFVGCHM